ncbi:gag/polymerase/env polyprotein, putative [Talaromyces stipitatus ATCC 10500]|uniref:Gag/polymerase/env polyprotein, putative n=1 Tax=Talaromyces stipitatus (strain ATCC 10500 / CBS 375.48 / QM 6759 / NRRL 1006) TaxID=441959 RepID=B8MV23_TALSN|nr:gag/polymerase/env polyprotein, putative [Talaromyces stipitatus ATCC 10500]EED11913.1 gag/polymerase/env polyprotein, putative [Talaromyces stipitatus ATCC 10500]
MKKVAIYATATTDIPSGIQKGVLVMIGRRGHHKLPYTKRGYLFQPEPKIDLATETYASAPWALLTTDTTVIPVANLGKTDIKIANKELVGWLQEIPPQSHRIMSMLTDDETELMEAFDDPIPFQIGFQDDPTNVELADISDEFGPEIKEKVIQLLKQHSQLFQSELGLLRGSRMPIPFKDDNLDGLKTSPYQMSHRDRAASNEILDALQKEGRIEPVPESETSSIASPGFIVWQNGKPRFVVDMRKINVKLLLNSYPLPRQDDVFEAVGGSCIFSSMDIRKEFFQQPIDEKDRWKTTFITPHHGLERLKVSTMGLATTPSFFQQRMENILRPYLWKTVIVSPDEHLNHFGKQIRLEWCGKNVAPFRDPNVS